MNHFMSLLKMNIKLLLRNKAFLFFLCVLPVLAVCMLNLNFSSETGGENAEHKIIELKKAEEPAVYVAEVEKYKIKVLDNSGSDLSEYMLESLAEAGMFSVCRYKAEDMSEKQARAQAKKDGYNDRIEVVLYVSKNFDKAVMNGIWEDAMQLYYVSNDDRRELFEESLTEILGVLQSVSLQSGGDQEMLSELLKAMDIESPDKRVVAVGGTEDIIQDKELQGCSDRMGYSFAILALGFAFCGVCIAYTVIEEQQNKVYTRMLLSKVSKLEYLLSKLIIAVGIACMQTVIIGVSMWLLVNQDFGMSLGQYLLIVFLLGNVFNIISLVVGVLIGEIMGANYAVFAIWTISSLASGMYFPLDESNMAIQTLSYLMPQRWFLKAAEMIMVGDKTAYVMLLYVTVAYLIVMLSVGVVGIRMKNTE